jgi:hypothetical protein
MTMQAHEEIDRPLAEALRALADDERALGASPSVKVRLDEEVARLRQATSRERRVTAVIYALAAAVIFAVLVPVWQTSRTARGATDATPSSMTPAEITTAFVPLTYGTVPFTGGHLVRFNVPRQAAARFGLMPFDALDSAAPDTVAADVLVGDDGLARAVRFVEPAIASTQREKQQ